MNLYKLHSEPTKLYGHDKRLLIPTLAWKDMNEMLTEKYSGNWRFAVKADAEFRHRVFDETEKYRE